MDSRSSWSFGYKTEDVVVDKLRRLGFDAKRTGDGRGADVVITRGDRQLTIEVKASALTQFAPGRKGYQFLLFKRDFSKTIGEDFIILVCVQPGGGYAWYVIPRRFVGSRHKIAIPNADPNRYDGIWSLYRDGWDLIKEDLG